MRKISYCIAATALYLLWNSNLVLAQPKTATIQNSWLELRWEGASGQFSLTSKASKRRFVDHAYLSATGGIAKITGITDRSFGRGQAIEVSLANGNKDTLMVFPGLPFALLRCSISNAEPAPRTVPSYRALSASIDLAHPANQLVTLGTGGLLVPDKNPGSYAWLAVADPPTRNGIVAGWLTFNRGSGILFSKVVDGVVRLEGQIDYGRLRLSPGHSEELETLAIGYFDDARLGLESWADTIAKLNQIHLPPQPAGYCTWYSRPYGGASDEKHLAEQAEFAAKNLAPFGFSVIQIDDGWQAGISTNGPKRNFTTHAEHGRYPSGMKAAADQVKSLGLTPGLWFMPFAGTYYDPFFKDHQDWFVRRENGQPYETDWGGTCLDMTRPDAQQYLRNNVRRIAFDWGFTYFKMDGLWTGTATKQIYVNDAYRPDGMGDAVFFNPEKTNLEAYRDGLRLVKETVGTNVFVLGCCSPQNMRSYGGAFGLVNAMRIGPDNGTDWHGLLRGPTYGSRQYFLHGRVWYNDPDPVYVRPELPLNEAQLICSWVTLSGQLNLNSEWLPGLPTERLDILKRTMPSHGLLPRPVDLFEASLPRIWLLSDTHSAPRRDVIGLFNWDDQQREFDYPLDRLGLATNVAWVGFDYWQNQVVPLFKGSLRLSVPGRSGRVLSVRPVSRHPELISTSRHITQGVVDVAGERWDNASRTLWGRSRIVGGDPYELRVLAFVPQAQPDPGWEVDTCDISSADRNAGVTIDSTQTNGLVRAVITAPTSREVMWSVRFHR